MKPEQQRIAIAEWCGWKMVPDQWYETRTAFVKDGERFAFCDLPDYLNDLNAIHEAEKKLGVNEWHQYMHILAEVMEDWRSICHATAAQRAEALLRTIGKWVDQ